MRRLLISLILIFNSVLTFGQLIDSTATFRLKDIQIDFNGSIQLWMRYSQLNPGSEVNGEVQDELFDLSVRRYRFGLNGRLTKRWYFKILFGQNNWNRANSLRIDLLDAYIAYAIDYKIRIGAGKSANSGLSRFAGPGTTTQIGSDLPLVVVPTINITDILTRRYNVFVNGHIGPIEYKAVVAMSILADRSFDVTENTDFVGNDEDLEYSAYVKYQFADSEYTRLDFGPGSYYGANKIIALGAGFKYQKDALGKLNLNQTQLYDMKHFAVDFFMELPFKGNYHALTTYLGYFNYDFGEDYIRNIGANNPINEGTSESFNGLGNRFPTVGTGNTMLWMTGYRFKYKQSSKLVLMPYFNYQLSDFTRLDDLMHWFDIGFNFLWYDRYDEFTIGFQNRPIFETNSQSDLKVTDRKYSIILQYQLKF